MINASKYGSLRKKSLMVIMIQKGLNIVETYVVAKWVVCYATFDFESEIGTVIPHFIIRWSVNIATTNKI